MTPTIGDLMDLLHRGDNHPKASWQELYNGLEQTLAEIDHLSTALQTADTALNDWVYTYAPEHCKTSSVETACARIEPYGIVAYVANVRAKIKRALAGVVGGTSANRRPCGTCAGTGWLSQGCSPVKTSESPETRGYHCGLLKADCNDEYCPTHGRDIR